MNLNFLIWHQLNNNMMSLLLITIKGLEKQKADASMFLLLKRILLIYLLMVLIISLNKE